MHDLFIFALGLFCGLAISLPPIVGRRILDGV